MKKSFLFAIVALFLSSFNLQAQSTVRVLKDSIPGEVGLRRTDGQLGLIQVQGGDHSLVDTATGALRVFAHTSVLAPPPSPSQGGSYSVQQGYLYSLNGRYPFLFYTAAATYAVSADSSGVLDTLFFSNGQSVTHFRVDTLMWLINGNRLYVSNLTDSTLLIDTGKRASDLNTNARAGHGGMYYIVETSQDSFVVYHHNGTVRKWLFATSISYAKLQSIGMLGGDFYFSAIVANSPGNNSIAFYKVSAAGSVTPLTVFPTHNGSAGTDVAIGAGKIWFPISGSNSNPATNFFVYDPQTNAVTQATAHTTSVLPGINNGSISPDSFLYYTKLTVSPGGGVAMYRTKSSSGSAQLSYGTTGNLTFGVFVDSTRRNSAPENRSFCNNYPVFHYSDTLYIGTATGITSSGLTTTFARAFRDWVKIGTSYYCVQSMTATTNRILKYTGCGIPQIQLGVAETQLVFATAQTYPNPSRGAFQVRHEALNHDAKAHLFSLDGKLQSIQTATGVGVLEVISQNLPAGIYILKVEQGKQQFTQRVEVL